MNPYRLFVWLVFAIQISFSAEIVAITDLTNYNAGSVVRLRLNSGQRATASIRYAGEEKPVVSGITVEGSKYQPLWNVPWEARTGRYIVDLTMPGGQAISSATGFAVHRQLAKIDSIELDKTFYTSGDSVNPHIVVRNLYNQPLTNLRVEFEAYTYPWISAAPDEAPAWRTVVADKLSLGPLATKAFDLTEAAVVHTQKESVISYYSVVIRDSTHLERIHDLAFAPPAFVTPANRVGPEEYPFLYLYSRESDVAKSESYRQFYPPQFVSDVITFDSAHTMFGTGAKPAFSFQVKNPDGIVVTRILSADGKTVNIPAQLTASGSPRHLTLEPLPVGLYTLEVAVEKNGITTAHNRLEFAVNPLPKSILIFCAHQDDDTAHPALIREAVENHIPLHFVYFTGGDAGGCDRYYWHSCGPARAMDFGEVRMNEARGSLGHLGVAPQDIEFLGLPDGGLEQIWYDHRNAADPYLSVLLASDHAPYREAAIPNLPFARDPVISATKDYITKYQPDLIVTGHPDERHVDHRTNNWLVVKAMQELAREGKLPHSTRLLVDVAYGAMPGRHAPYKFEQDTLHVPGEVSRMGQEALWYYQSQDGNHQQAKIVDFAHLPRTEPYPHFWVLDWWEHEGWNEHRPQ